MNVDDLCLPRGRGMESLLCKDHVKGGRLRGLGGVDESLTLDRIRISAFLTFSFSSPKFTLHSASQLNTYFHHTDYQQPTTKQ